MGIAGGKSSLRVGNPSITGRALDVVLSFECYENQRWWVGLGWVAHLLPAERTAWTDFAGTRATPRESFELLPFRSEQLMAWRDEVPLDAGLRYAWDWDGPWYVDLKGGGQVGEVDEEGWAYADNFWKDWKNKKTLKRVVRHRRWIRHARLFELGPKQNVKFFIDQCDSLQRHPGHHQQHHQQHDVGHEDEYRLTGGGEEEDQDLQLEQQLQLQLQLQLQAQEGEFVPDDVYFEQSPFITQEEYYYN